MEGEKLYTLDVATPIMDTIKLDPKMFIEVIITDEK